MGCSKSSAQCQNAIYLTFQRIRQEYNELMTACFVSTTNSTLPPFSLLELFENDEHNHRVINLIDFCQQWKPHPDRDEISIRCLEFWNQTGLGTINRRINDYINCAMFMYTSGSIDRVVTLTNLIAVDFHLNDVMGRDLFLDLSSHDQQEARQLIQRLIDLTNPHLQSTTTVNPIEKAMKMLYDQLRANSPVSWFEEFTKLFNHHLNITHRDNTSSTSCRILTLEEYTTARIHMAGMLYSTALIEYANGCFFDWKAMQKEQLAIPIKRLQRVIAEVVGFINDLFSFEKEIIDSEHQNDSNLILIIALNYPTLSLRQIIHRAASMIRDLLQEYIQLSTSIQKQLRASKERGSQMNTMLIYLDSIADFIRTYWIWHSNSPRYKRKISIWLETNQSDGKISY